MLSINDLVITKRKTNGTHGVIPADTIGKVKTTHDRGCEDYVKVSFYGTLALQTFHVENLTKWEPKVGERIEVTATIPNGYYSEEVPAGTRGEITSFITGSGRYARVKFDNGVTRGTWLYKTKPVVKDNPETTKFEQARVGKLMTDNELNVITMAMRMKDKPVRAPYGDKFEYVTIDDAEKRLVNQRNSILEDMNRLQDATSKLIKAETASDVWQKRALVAEQKLKYNGIVELAVDNISVADYMNHWEKRALDAEARAVRAERELGNMKMNRENSAKPVGITLIYPNGSSEFLRVDSEARTKLYVKETSASPQSENFREAEQASANLKADKERVDTLNERFLSKHPDPRNVQYDPTDVEF